MLLPAPHSTRYYSTQGIGLQFRALHPHPLRRNSVKMCLTVHALQIFSGILLTPGNYMITNNLVPG